MLLLLLVYEKGHCFRRSDSEMRWTFPETLYKSLFKYLSILGNGGYCEMRKSFRLNLTFNVTMPKAIPRSRPPSPYMSAIFRVLTLTFLYSSKKK